MPKVSFRMASASRKSVVGGQTSTARKNHRSDHTEGPVHHHAKRMCVRKGTVSGTSSNQLKRLTMSAARHVRLGAITENAAMQIVEIDGEPATEEDLHRVAVMNYGHFTSMQ